MPNEKLIIAAFRDTEQARLTAGELRIVGFRDDQLVVALQKRPSDRKGLLSPALQRHGANSETCTFCDQLFVEGQAVIAVRSRARNKQAGEVMVRGGGVVQFDGDAEAGRGGAYLGD